MKYIAGAVFTLPLLPILYFQGKKVRKEIPRLPEADDTRGLCSVDQSDTQVNLVTIGESTMAGVGVLTHQDGLTGTLACEISKRLDINVSWSVYAKSGYTVSMIRHMLVPLISEDKVDLIVIGVGGNDAFMLNTPSKWKRHIADLVAGLRQKFKQVPIVFINMPPVKDFPAFTPLMKAVFGNLIEILGDELAAVVGNQEEVYYLHERIKLCEWLQREEKDAKVSDFFSDGVHPSKMTYQIWAKDIAKAVQDMNVIK